MDGFFFNAESVSPRFGWTVLRHVRIHKITGIRTNGCNHYFIRREPGFDQVKFAVNIDAVSGGLVLTFSCKGRQRPRMSVCSDPATLETVLERTLPSALYISFVSDLTYARIKVEAIAYCCFIPILASINVCIFN